MSEAVTVEMVGGPLDGEVRALQDRKSFPVVCPVRMAGGYGQREMGRYEVTDRTSRAGLLIAQWREA